VRTIVVALGSSLKDIERETIRRTLAEVTYHREKAVKILGISLRALQYKIKEYAYANNPPAVLVHCRSDQPVPLPIRNRCVSRLVD
jgi:DNA-binding NtrC family response regulator